MHLFHGLIIIFNQEGPPNVYDIDHENRVEIEEFWNINTSKETIFAECLAKIKDFFDNIHSMEQSYLT